MAEQEWKPAIISAKFDPNPATANSSTLLSVLVIDAYGYERIEPLYANEFLSNEV